MRDIHYKFMSHNERRCNRAFPQALLECMYISWFYGLDRLDDELEQRSGLTMNEFWYLMILINDNTRYFATSIN